MYKYILLLCCIGCIPGASFVGKTDNKVRVTITKVSGELIPAENGRVWTAGNYYTIVQTKDGREYKFQGRLGKEGDSIVIDLKEGEPR